MRQNIIVGGSGFIGTHLARRLLRRGEQVHVLDLEPPAVTGVHFHLADIRRPVPSTTDLPAGARIFNFAAVHRTPGHADHAYYDTNVQGAIHTLGLARRLDTKELAFTSSIAVYGPAEAPRDEGSPLRPNSSYGRSKAIAELLHAEWGADNPGRRLIMARPAVIFGPGEGGNFTRLARALGDGRFAYPGRRDTVKACGFVDDFLDSIDHWLDRASTGTVTYNFAYPEPVTIEHVVRAMCATGGLPLPRVVPEPLVVGLLAAANLTHPQTGARIKKLRHSTNIVPRALLESGFEWRTDLPTALALWWESAPKGAFT